MIIPTTALFAKFVRITVIPINKSKNPIVPNPSKGCTREAIRSLIPVVSAVKKLVSGMITPIIIKSSHGTYLAAIWLKLITGSLW